MANTSASLLEQLRVRPDEASWQRLVELYTPLIRNWLQGHALVHAADADDVVQEVLAVVVRKLPGFRHNQRPGAFRCWLRTITANCLRDFWRSQRSQARATEKTQLSQLAEQLADPDSGLSRLWDREHDQFIARRLLESIRPRFQGVTWQAFQRVALDGEAPDVVADALGISVNAVFIAKSRVLSQLRREAAGLID